MRKLNKISVESSCFPFTSKSVECLVGSIFKFKKRAIDDSMSIYILACVGNNKYCLVNLKTGNVWNSYSVGMTLYDILNELDLIEEVTIEVL